MVAKRSVVQKMQDIERFNKVLNLHCDLDLENNNLIFTQNTPAYDMVKTVILDYISPKCDPELEDSKP